MWSFVFLDNGYIKYDFTFSWEDVFQGSTCQRRFSDIEDDHSDAQDSMAQVKPIDRT